MQRSSTTDDGTNVAGAAATLFLSVLQRQCIRRQIRSACICRLARRHNTSLSRTACRLNTAVDIKLNRSCFLENELIHPHLPHRRIQTRCTETKVVRGSHLTTYMWCITMAALHLSLFSTTMARRWWNSRQDIGMARGLVKERRGAKEHTAILSEVAVVLEILGVDHYLRLNSWTEDDQETIPGSLVRIHSNIHRIRRRRRMENYRTLMDLFNKLHLYDLDNAHTILHLYMYRYNIKILAAL